MPVSHFKVAPEDAHSVNASSREPIPAREEERPTRLPGLLFILGVLWLVSGLFR